MRSYRPNRVVNALSMLASIAYFGLGILGILMLIGTPALKVFASDNPEWEWSLPVPATITDSATVSTSWGSARLELEEVRANLRMPIASLPWSIFAVLWAHLAVYLMLMLLFLRQLRGIFLRVRGGAPFDDENARKLRRLGMLLLGLAVLGGVTRLVTAMAVRSGLNSSTVEVSTGLHVDVSMVLMAMVLIALAEIFRRGAELETEHSLVV